MLGSTLLTSIVALTPRKINQVEAFEKGSVVTNINLNDLSDNYTRNYYLNLNLLSESERQGYNLLKNLKSILKDGQKYFAYDSDSSNDIFRMYEIVDRDWKKSPASEISGYDAATNPIIKIVWYRSGRYI